MTITVIVAKPNPATGADSIIAVVITVPVTATNHSNSNDSNFRINYSII